MGARPTASEASDRTTVERIHSRTRLRRHDDKRALMADGSRLSEPFHRLQPGAGGQTEPRSH